jgi:hypothetical protein
MSQATRPSQPPRGKNDALTLSLDQLRQALASELVGHEKRSLERLADALGCIVTALRQHRADAKSTDGVLAEVDETRPTLARRADTLRSDHDNLLMEVRGLRDKVARTAESFTPSYESSTDEGISRNADFDDLREQAEKVASSLQQNKDAEVDLIQESVNTDIGVGD